MIPIPPINYWMYISAAFQYVTSDFYFWPAMTFTTLIGIFIGSVIYDGDMQQVKKGIVTIGSYAAMIALVTITRILPAIIANTLPRQVHQPFASIETILVVTVFYLLGMFVGVFVTKRAHNEL